MHDNSSEYGRQFITPIILTVLTIILGFISFQTVFPDYPFSRKLYYTFQLFTLESGDRFYENGVQPLWVIITFDTARFLAVATLIVTIVLAILSVLKYNFFMLKVRWMKGHTILCGLGGVGEAFAESVENKNELVIIEKDTTNENISRLKKEGAVIIEANALDTEVLKRIDVPKADCLLALTGNDFDNLTIINNALKLIKEKKEKESKETNPRRVSLIANIDSRNLKAAITEEWQYRPDCLECDLKTSVNDFYTTADKLLEKRKLSVTDTALESRFAALKSILLNYNPVRANCGIDIKNIQLFNINQLAGRYIFLNYSPDRFRRITQSTDKAMKILLLGFSNVGEELLKQCIQNCYYLNQKNTKISLVSFDGDIIKERIRSKYKNISRLIELNIINHNPHHLTYNLLNEFDIKAPDVIYICSSEDRYQASYSSKARELFGDSIPIIRPFYRKNVLCRTEVCGNTFSFNIFSKVSKRDYIVDEILDKRAITVHNRWIKQAVKDYVNKVDLCLSDNKEIPEPKPTLAPWHLLDEEVREDNRSVVDHINIKLRSVFTEKDLDFFVDPGSVKIGFWFLKDASKVEQLAEMEHRRWMANKFICGWIYDEQRNDSEKKHDCLKDYSELPDYIKQFDRQQVKEMEETIKLGNTQQPDKKKI
jgi:rubredoxin